MSTASIITFSSNCLMHAPNPWVVSFNQSWLLFMVYAVKHLLTVNRKVYAHMMCSDKKGSVGK